MLKQLINSLRIPACLLGVVLMAGSFRLAGLPVSPVYIAAIFVIGCLTMIQNDWVDRYHDIKSGRPFASENPTIFFAWLLVFYIVSAIFICFAIMENTLMGLVLLVVSVLSVSYSLTYKIPFVASIWVAGIAGSTALLPMVVIGLSWPNIQLFLATVFFVLGREILKDLDDVYRDKGYKWTIPVAFGAAFALNVAWILILLGGVMLLTITYLSVLASLPIVLGLLMLKKGKYGSKTRTTLDIGVVLAICILIIFPPGI